MRKSWGDGHAKFVGYRVARLGFFRLDRARTKRQGLGLQARAARRLCGLGDAKDAGLDLFPLGHPACRGGQGALGLDVQARDDLARGRHTLVRSAISPRRHSKRAFGSSRAGSVW